MTVKRYTQVRIKRAMSSFNTNYVAPKDWLLEVVKSYKGWYILSCRRPHGYARVRARRRDFRIPRRPEWAGFIEVVI